jgi:glycosyltransferase involved in cell wall biosynthesis
VARPVIVFSPLPPAKSGIADYTLELLPALAALRPVVVVSERPAQAPAGAGWRTLGLDDYLRDPSLGQGPHLYQIGNNADHVFAYRAFRRQPGILVQHDFNLHYLVEDATLAAGDPAGYREVLREEYGEPGATLADLRQAGLFSESQKLTLPLNTHLLRQAHGLIVHNQWVHDQVPADVRERTSVVPHHFAPQALHYDGLTPDGARASLGLPADEFIVLSLGYITPPKQIQATLAALAVLRRRGARLTYVIGGARDPGFDIDAHVQRLGLSQCVRITGYLDEPSFFSYIRAADVLVNLRFPNVGESSGTLARALAMGLPAVVYNFGPLSELPDDTVVKVPLELGQPTALAAALEGLMLNPAWRHHIGQRAQRHMRTHCSVEHSAALYSAFIDQVYESSPVRADLDRLPPGQPLAVVS